MAKTKSRSLIVMLMALLLVFSVAFGVSPMGAFAEPTTETVVATIRLKDGSKKDVTGGGTINFETATDAVSIEVMTDKISDNATLTWSGDPTKATNLAYIFFTGNNKAAWDTFTAAIEQYQTALKGKIILSSAIYAEATDATEYVISAESREGYAYSKILELRKIQENLFASADKHYLNSAKAQIELFRAAGEAAILSLVGNNLESDYAKAMDRAFDNAKSTMEGVETWEQAVDAAWTSIRNGATANSDAEIDEAEDVFFDGKGQTDTRNLKTLLSAGSVSDEDANKLLADRTTLALESLANAKDHRVSNWVEKVAGTEGLLKKDNWTSIDYVAATTLADPAIFSDIEIQTLKNLWAEKVAADETLPATYELAKSAVTEKITDVKDSVKSAVETYIVPFNKDKKMDWALYFDYEASLTPVMKSFLQALGATVPADADLDDMWETYNNQNKIDASNPAALYVLYLNEDKDTVEPAIKAFDALKADFDKYAAYFGKIEYFVGENGFLNKADTNANGKIDKDDNSFKYIYDEAFGSKKFDNAYSTFNADYTANNAIYDAFPMDKVYGKTVTLGETLKTLKAVVDSVKSGVAKVYKVDVKVKLGEKTYATLDEAKTALVVSSMTGTVSYGENYIFADNETVKYDSFKYDITAQTGYHFGDANTNVKASYTFKADDFNTNTVIKTEEIKLNQYDVHYDGKTVKIDHNTVLFDAIVDLEENANKIVTSVAYADSADKLASNATNLTAETASTYKVTGEIWVKFTAKDFTSNSASFAAADGEISSGVTVSSNNTANVKVEYTDIVKDTGTATPTVLTYQLKLSDLTGVSKYAVRVYDVEGKDVTVQDVMNGVRETWFVKDTTLQNVNANTATHSINILDSDGNVLTGTKVYAFYLYDAENALTGVKYVTVEYGNYEVYTVVIEGLEKTETGYKYAEGKNIEIHVANSNTLADSDEYKAIKDNLNKIEVAQGQTLIGIYRLDGSAWATDTAKHMIKLSENDNKDLVANGEKGWSYRVYVRTDEVAVGAVNKVNSDFEGTDANVAVSGNKITVTYDDVVDWDAIYAVQAKRNGFENGEYGADDVRKGHIFAGIDIQIPEGAVYFSEGSFMDPTAVAVDAQKLVKDDVNVTANSYPVFVSIIHKVENNWTSRNAKNAETLKLYFYDKDGNVISVKDFIVTVEEYKEYSVSVGSVTGTGAFNGRNNVSDPLAQPIAIKVLRGKSLEQSKMWKALMNGEATRGGLELGSEFVTMKAKEVTGEPDPDAPVEYEIDKHSGNFVQGYYNAATIDLTTITDKKIDTTKPFVDNTAAEGAPSNEYHPTNIYVYWLQPTYNKDFTVEGEANARWATAEDTALVLTKDSSFETNGKLNVTYNDIYGKSEVVVKAKAESDKAKSYSIDGYLKTPTAIPTEKFVSHAVGSDVAEEDAKTIAENTQTVLFFFYDESGMLIEIKEVNVVYSAYTWNTVTYKDELAGTTITFNVLSGNALSATESTIKGTAKYAEIVKAYTDKSYEVGSIVDGKYYAGRLIEKTSVKEEVTTVTYSALNDKEVVNEDMTIVDRWIAMDHKAAFDKIASVEVNVNKLDAALKHNNESVIKAEIDEDGNLEFKFTHYLNSTSIVNKEIEVEFTTAESFNFNKDGNTNKKTLTFELNFDTNGVPSIVLKGDKTLATEYFIIHDTVSVVAVSTLSAIVVTYNPITVTVQNDVMHGVEGQTLQAIFEDNSKTPKTPGTFDDDSKTYFAGYMYNNKYIGLNSPIDEEILGNLTAITVTEHSVAAQEAVQAKLTALEGKEDRTNRDQVENVVVNYASGVVNLEYTGFVDFENALTAQAPGAGYTRPENNSVYVPFFMAMPEGAAFITTTDTFDDNSKIVGMDIHGFFPTDADFTEGTTIVEPFYIKLATKGTGWTFNKFVESVAEGKKIYTNQGDRTSFIWDKDGNLIQVVTMKIDYKGIKQADGTYKAFDKQEESYKEYLTAMIPTWYKGFAAGIKNWNISLTTATSENFTQEIIDLIDDNSDFFKALDSTKDATPFADTYLGDKGVEKLLVGADKGFDLEVKNIANLVRLVKILNYVNITEEDSTVDKFTKTYLSGDDTFAPYDEAVFDEAINRLVGIYKTFMYTSFTSDGSDTLYSKWFGRGTGTVLTAVHNSLIAITKAEYILDKVEAKFAENKNLYSASTQSTISGKIDEYKKAVENARKDFDAYIAGTKAFTEIFHDNSSYNDIAKTLNNALSILNVKLPGEEASDSDWELNTYTHDSPIIDGIVDAQQRLEDAVNGATPTYHKYYYTEAQIAQLEEALEEGKKLIAQSTDLSQLRINEAEAYRKLNAVQDRWDDLEAYKTAKITELNNYRKNVSLQKYNFVVEAIKNLDLGTYAVDMSKRGPERYNLPGFNFANLNSDIVFGDIIGEDGNRTSGFKGRIDALVALAKSIIDWENKRLDLERNVLAKLAEYNLNQYPSSSDERYLSSAFEALNGKFPEIHDAKGNIPELYTILKLLNDALAQYSLWVESYDKLPLFGGLTVGADGSLAADRAKVDNYTVPAAPTTEELRSMSLEALLAYNVYDKANDLVSVATTEYFGEASDWIFRYSEALPSAYVETVEDLLKTLGLMKADGSLAEGVTRPLANMANIDEVLMAAFAKVDSETLQAQLDRAVAIYGLLKPNQLNDTNIKNAKSDYDTIAKYDAIFDKVVAAIVDGFEKGADATKPVAVPELYGITTREELLAAQAAYDAFTNKFSVGKTVTVKLSSTATDTKDVVIARSHMAAAEKIILAHIIAKYDATTNAAEYNYYKGFDLTEDGNEGNIPEGINGGEETPEYTSYYVSGYGDILDTMLNAFEFGDAIDKDTVEANVNKKEISAYDATKFRTADRTKVATFVEAYLANTGIVKYVDNNGAEVPEGTAGATPIYKWMHDLIPNAVRSAMDTFIDHYNYTFALDISYVKYGKGTTLLAGTDATNFTGNYEIRVDDTKLNALTMPEGNETVEYYIPGGAGEFYTNYTDADATMNNAYRVSQIDSPFVANGITDLKEAGLNYENYTIDIKPADLAKQNGKVKIVVTFGLKLFTVTFRPGTYTDSTGTEVDVPTLEPIPAVQEVYYNDAVSVPAADPRSAGRAFVGWTFSNNHDIEEGIEPDHDFNHGATTFDFTTANNKVTHNLYITAQWVEVGYFDEADVSKFTEHSEITDGVTGGNVDAAWVEKKDVVEGTTQITKATIDYVDVAEWAKANQTVTGRENAIVATWAIKLPVGTNSFTHQLADATTMLPADDNVNVASYDAGIFYYRITLATKDAQGNWVAVNNDAYTNGMPILFKFYDGAKTQDGKVSGKLIGSKLLTLAKENYEEVTVEFKNMKDPKKGIADDNLTSVVKYTLLKGNSFTDTKYTTVSVPADQTLTGYVFDGWRTAKDNAAKGDLATETYKFTENVVYYSRYVEETKLGKDNVEAITTEIPEYTENELENVAWEVKDGKIIVTYNDVVDWKANGKALGLIDNNAYIGFKVKVPGANYNSREYTRQNTELYTEITGSDYDTYYLSVATNDGDVWTSVDSTEQFRPLFFYDGDGMLLYVFTFGSNITPYIEQTVTINNAPIEVTDPDLSAITATIPVLKGNALVAKEGVKGTAGFKAYNYDVNGEYAISSDRKIVRFNTLSAKEKKTETKYLFAGWFDKDGKAYDLTTAVTADIEITARWVVISTAEFSENVNNIEDINLGSGSDIVVTYDDIVDFKAALTAQANSNGNATSNNPILYIGIDMYRPTAAKYVSIDDKLAPAAAKNDLNKVVEDPEYVNKEPLYIPWAKFIGTDKTDEKQVADWKNWDIFATINMDGDVDKVSHIVYFYDEDGNMIAGYRYTLSINEYEEATIYTYSDDKQEKTPMQVIAGNALASSKAFSEWYDNFTGISRYTYDKDHEATFDGIRLVTNGEDTTYGNLVWGDVVNNLDEFTALQLGEMVEGEIILAAHWVEDSPLPKENVTFSVDEASEVKAIKTEIATQEVAEGVEEAYNYLKISYTDAVDLTGGKNAKFDVVADGHNAQYTFDITLKNEAQTITDNRVVIVDEAGNILAVYNFEVRVDKYEDFTVTIEDTRDGIDSITLKVLKGNSLANTEAFAEYNRIYGEIANHNNLMYVFEGYRLVTEGKPVDVRYNIETVLESDITLQAKWTEVDPLTYIGQAKDYVVENISITKKLDYEDAANGIIDINYSDFVNFADLKYEERTENGRDASLYYIGFIFQAPVGTNRLEYATTKKDGEWPQSTNIDDEANRYHYIWIPIAKELNGVSMPIELTDVAKFDENGIWEFNYIYYYYEDEDIISVQYVTFRFHKYGTIVSDYIKDNFNEDVATLTDEQINTELEKANDCLEMLEKYEGIVTEAEQAKVEEYKALLEETLAARKLDSVRNEYIEKLDKYFAEKEAEQNDETSKKYADSDWAIMELIYRTAREDLADADVTPTEDDIIARYENAVTALDAFNYIGEDPSVLQAAKNTANTIIDAFAALIEGLFQNDFDNPDFTLTLDDGSEATLGDWLTERVDNAKVEIAEAPSVEEIDIIVTEFVETVNEALNDKLSEAKDAAADLIDAIPEGYEDYASEFAQWQVTYKALINSQTTLSGVAEMIEAYNSVRDGIVASIDARIAAELKAAIDAAIARLNDKYADYLMLATFEEVKNDIDALSDIENIDDIAAAVAAIEEKANALVATTILENAKAEAKATCADIIREVVPVEYRENETIKAITDVYESDIDALTSNSDIEAYISTFRKNLVKAVTRLNIAESLKSEAAAVGYRVMAETSATFDVSKYGITDAALINTIQTAYEALLENIDAIVDANADKYDYAILESLINIERLTFITDTVIPAMKQQRDIDLEHINALAKVFEDAELTGDDLATFLENIKDMFLGNFENVDVFSKAVVNEVLSSESFASAVKELGLVEQEDIDALKAELVAKSDYDAKVAELQKAIEDVRSGLGTDAAVTNAISELQQSIKNLEKSIKDLQSAEPPTVDTSELDGRVEKLEKESWIKWFTLAIVLVVIVLLVIILVLMLRRRGNDDDDNDDNNDDGDPQEPAPQVPEEPEDSSDDSEVPPEEEISATEDNNDLPGDTEVGKKKIKTFQEVLFDTSDKNKMFYSEIKNKLTSYRKVKSKFSKRNESFRHGRDLVARLGFAGKTLKLYLALDPNEFDPNIYPHKDVSDKKKYLAVPMLIKVKSQRMMGKADDLIEQMMAKKGYLPRRQIETVDYVKALIKPENTPLGQSGHADLYCDSADTTAAQAFPDRDAEKAIVIEEYTPESEPVKANVSIADINANFPSGATVDLKALLKKKLVNKDVNFYKVTADGEVTKPLNVKANSFALDAAKMIMLTGGKAIRLKAVKNN